MNDSKKPLFELCLETMQLKKDISYYEECLKYFKMTLQTGFGADKTSLIMKEIVDLLEKHIESQKELYNDCARAISSDTSKQTGFGNISGQVRKARF